MVVWFVHRYTYTLKQINHPPKLVYSLSISRDSSYFQTRSSYRESFVDQNEVPFIPVNASYHIVGSLHVLRDSLARSNGAFTNHVLPQQFNALLARQHKTLPATINREDFGRIHCCTPAEDTAIIELSGPSVLLQEAGK